MAKLPFTYGKFRSIYSQVPRLCVDLVITSSDGLLLAKRGLESWKGQWYLPGGTVYYKETLNQAAKRVAKDELCIDIDIDKNLGYIEYISEEKARGFGWSVGIVFQCHIVSGILSDSEQVKEPQFFKQLPEQMIEEQKEFLQKISNVI